MNRQQWDLAIHETGHAILFDELRLAFESVAANPADGRGAVRWAVNGQIPGRRFLIVVVAGPMATDIDGRSQLLDNKRISRRISIIHKRTDFRDSDGDVFKALCLAHAPVGYLLANGLPLPPDGVQKVGDDDILENTPQIDAALQVIVVAETEAEQVLRRRWPEVLGVARTLCRRKSHRLTFNEFNRRVFDLQKKLLRSKGGR